MSISDQKPDATSYRFREDIGHRLLPHVVDELAQSEPNRVLYEYPSNNENLNDAFVEITARQYGNSINRTAWWLEKALGKRPSTPTIGYEGPQDLRYLLLLIGAIKAGYRMLFTSPRNTIEGDVAVIKGAECSIWLTPSHGSHAQRLQEHVKLETLTLPDLDFFLDTTPVPHYEYHKEWAVGSREHAWILHTSGSTGNPKPVFRFLDSVASVGANNLLPRIGGRPLLLHDFYDTRVYLTFPFYHGAGLVNGMLWPIYHGTTIILGPQKPVSIDLMKDVIRRTKPTAVFTAPSLVEDISKDSEFLQLLHGVKALAYGGGPVSVEAGNRIWQHTKLRLSIGTTEAGWMPCVETDPEDWNYIHPHPNDGFQFRLHSDGLYELVIAQQPQLAQWQPIFSTFPELEEYSTKDLWSKHPTKEGLYRYQGRADNIIVLSNGEKVQPNNMELVIGAHPLIKAAVIAGQGRFQTSVIVELIETSHPKTEKERKALIQEIYPSIEAANKLAPSHGKIHQDFIVIGNLNKPFPRTPKSTVRRGPTIQLYADELESVYAQAELNGDGEHTGPQVDLRNFESLSRSLQEIILGVSGLVSLGEDDDFFTVAGLDSLQVIATRRKLLRSLPHDSGINAEALTPAIIYKNPTVAKLASAISDLSKGDHVVTDEQSTGSLELAHELIAKYSKDLPPHVDHESRRQYRVLLTGSTGSLGSYILDHLINTKDVQEVWALNRSVDGEARQTQLNAQRGLRTDFRTSNVHFLQADLAEERLGLQQTDYDDIVERLTHIIGSVHPVQKWYVKHEKLIIACTDVRWQVDFNLSLASFEPNIRGARNLADLAHQSSNTGKTVKYLFTSSVGVANRQAKGREVISEEPLTDFEAASNGYGESKLVAEHILLEASKQSGVDVTICRVGQIAGPIGRGHENGEWTRKEWLPTLIDASAHLSILPETLGRNETTDWIPVDLLSSIIFEIATAEALTPNAPRIVHAVNPQKVEWRDALLPTVFKHLNASSRSDKPLKISSLADWVRALEEAAKGDPSGSPGGTADALTAVKLLPFYNGLLRDGTGPTFETTKASALSPTLRELPAVNAEWAAQWLQQWGYKESI